jgi:NADH-quinone oxidoreductase subunit M
MGGIGFRAPALAGLLLILAFATLAMPGTANFVGELLIVFGAFEDKLTWGLVAVVGIVLASVYMIRFFIRAMHNPPAPGVESREACALEVGVIAPLVAIVVALGVYPQVILEGTEKAVARVVTDGQPRPAVSAIDGQPPAGEGPVGPPEAYNPEDFQP